MGKDARIRSNRALLKSTIREHPEANPGTTTLSKRELTRAVIKHERSNRKHNKGSKS